MEDGVNSRAVRRWQCKRSNSDASAKIEKSLHLTAKNWRTDQTAIVFIPRAKDYALGDSADEPGAAPPQYLPVVRDGPCLGSSEFGVGAGDDKSLAENTFSAAFKCGNTAIVMTYPRVKAV